MCFPKPEIFYFAASLIYVVVAICCFAHKFFHVCKPYQKNEEYYFPARKVLAFAWLFQIFELSYTLNIQSETSLMFVNAVSLICMPAFIRIIYQQYFLLRKMNTKEVLVSMMSPILLCAILAIIVFGFPTFNEKYKTIVFWAVILACLSEVIRLLIIIIPMHRDTIKLNKMEYSNISNFSQKLVRNYTIIPIIWLILFLYVYISGSQDAKMFRDIAYAICILSIAIYNLNTDRQEDYVEYMNKKEQEQICEEVTENVSDRNAKLLKSIIELMENEQIFLNSDLRLQDIVKRLNSNRNYVSEAIVQSEYGSFYFLVNSFRVDYAAKLITENPNFTMDAIAMQSGFSSRQILTKSFKEHKKKSPSEYKIIS